MTREDERDCDRLIKKLTGKLVDENYRLHKENKQLRETIKEVTERLANLQMIIESVNSK